MKDLLKTLVESKQQEKIAEKVQKRDGSIVEFDPVKIVNAVNKAFEASGEGNEIKAWEVTALTISKMCDSIMHIENIQDIVENTLMDMGFRKTAKSYILYRAKRSELRNINKTLHQSFKLIDDYIEMNDWRVNENSNMSYSLQGLNTYIASTVTSKYWLSKLYTPQITDAHNHGYMHIHDLGSLSTYCVGWDLEQLLIKGFTGVSGKISSKPAKHFRPLLGQIANFFYTLQGEAAGAQAFSNFDTLLAPFIKYDNLSYDDVKQAMQEFIFNLNIPTRTGFQTPFTNITFDLTVPSYLKDKPVICGGILTDDTYGEFNKEMRWIHTAFAEVMLKGDALGRPFSFPIPTYNITCDFDWNNPDYIILWEMTAKYGIPYFSNFIKSSMHVEDARSMCCRLKLDNRKVREHIEGTFLQQTSAQQNSSQEEDTFKNTENSVHRGGIFAANPMTGSIGVVTINLPRCAYESKNEQDFVNNIKNIMELAFTSLEIKRKIIEDLTEAGLYPYTKAYLQDIKSKTKKYWKQHFSTIGLVGMNEAFENLFQKSYASEDGKQFGIRILKEMKAITESFSETSGNLYNLEASPAESAGYRLAQIDTLLYRDIITSGTSDIPYYTNSVLLPVSKTDDIFELLEHQEEMQSIFTGGTVIHVFLGEQVKDIQSIPKFIKNMASHYSIPYFSLTPIYSICPVHGYINGKHEVCPYSHTDEQLLQFGIATDQLSSSTTTKFTGNNNVNSSNDTGTNNHANCKLADANNNKVIPTEIYSRVVGYYRPVSQWNKGKKQEFGERKTYDSSYKKML